MPTGSLFPDFLNLPSQIHQTFFSASEPHLQTYNYEMEARATTRRTAAPTTTVSPIIFFPTSDEAAKCNLTPGGSGKNPNCQLTMYRVGHLVVQ